jgi:hypothetical protein
MKYTVENLPKEKFPHISFTEKTIATNKKLVELFNKRKEISEPIKENLNDFEANERNILIVKTEIELSKVHTSIIKNELHLKEFIEGCIRVLNEMENNYEQLIAKCERKKKQDEKIASILATRDEELFKDNLEQKINFYLSLRDHSDTPTKLTKL